MPEMIALRELYYDGKTIHKGERFTLLPQHERLYQILKRAEPAPPQEPEPEPEQQPARGARRRAMLPADPQPVPETAPGTAAASPPEPPVLPHGRYGRRDMRPADDTDAN